MRQTQKRLATRTSFAFGENELTYTFRNRQGVRQAVIDYLDLSRTRRHTAVRDWSRFQLGALLAICGVVAAVAQSRLAGFDPLAALWLAPGCVYLCLFVCRQSHFLVVNEGTDQLWILDDTARQGIVAELDLRRRDRIAEIYGPLNLANEPYLEIRKIEWLVEESVLTRDQADDQIRLVESKAAARAEEVAEAARPTAVSWFEREAIAV